MIWKAIIIAALSFQVDVPEKVPPEAWTALKEIALELEIVGPNENWATDFNTELKYVRRHYQYLKDAPHLVDSTKLPDTKFSLSCRDFNEKFQAYLVMRKTIYPSREEEIDDYIIAAKKLYLIWEYIYRAKGEKESWSVRRRALKELKELIGEENYYNMNFPPPVFCTNANL